MVRPISAIIFLAAALALFPMLAGAAPAENFNRMMLTRAEVESRFGITTLECFPFLEKIGFNEDQARRVGHCLKGLETLASALEEAPDSGIKMFGISARFMRTAGFHVALVPWDAPKGKMVDFLKDKPSPDDQSLFLENIRTLKRKIMSGLNIIELYCTRNISNEDCLRAYETLAGIPPTDRIRKKRWREVAVTDSFAPLKNPAALALKFDADAGEIADQLANKNLGENWAVWRKAYRVVDEKYGEAFRTRLKMPNFFCAVTIAYEQCLLAAANLYEASADEGLQNRPWGEVMVNRHNTFIRNDSDIALRYDLPPDEIVRYFSRKPMRKEVEKNVTLAEKLEKRTRNNWTGLRAVCDLGDLPSGLCVKGLQTFISFVKGHRGYRVDAPWTEIMFVDGDQLTRVNFALNSSSRNTYIYIHANSELAEMEKHLAHFGSDSDRNR